MEINLLGTFLCARAVLTGMTGRGHGRIVNVASGAGIEGPPFVSAYVVSKAAVIRLSEELAMETEQYGVAVFAIDPGWMLTAMTNYLANSEQGIRWTPSAPRSSIRKRTFRRPARPTWWPRSRLVERTLSVARYLTVWDDLDELLGRIDQIRREDLLRVRLRK